MFLQAMSTLRELQIKEPVEIQMRQSLFLPEVQFDKKRSLFKILLQEPL